MTTRAPYGYMAAGNPGAGTPLTPGQQQACLTDQQRLISFSGYYSAVGFTAAPDGAGNYKINAGTKPAAFSYNLGQVAAVAGLAALFPAGTTYVETNLQEAGKTIGGTRLNVTGMAIQPFPISDPVLVKALWGNVHCRIEFNGAQNNIELGPLHRIAGASGLYGLDPAPGAGADFSGTPHLIGHTTNGLPGIDNYRKVREGFTWSDQGADSNMSMPFEVVRDILIPIPAAIIAAPVNVANITPVQAFTPPAQLVCILSISLLGDLVGPRSQIV
jgi:hypothetical protein